MNSRAYSKQIQQKERLVRRANTVSAIMRYLGWLTTFIVLVLFWESVVTFFGLSLVNDSLFRIIKGMADFFALPFRGLVKSFPGIGGTLETIYVLAMGVYGLVYVLIGQLLRVFVRVPGA